jgi:inosose dehydratase
VIPMSARVSGAPITWGICEVPGWGYQLPPERVLGEMRSIGLRATELGPEGFLPSDPARLRERLGIFDIQLVGGFIGLALHRSDRWQEELSKADHAASLLSALGCNLLVLAAATGEDGYDGSVELDDEGWMQLVQGIDDVVEIAGDRGVSVAFHPHYGTVIERTHQVDRLLQNSSVPLCLDTGHLTVGGIDPVELVRDAADRVIHVHLKDVEGQLAESVRRRSVGYMDAVRDGMYLPLGEGDVDVATVVRMLEDNGYIGWYVLEQDVVLESPPEEGRGPIEDARASLQFLSRIAKEIGSGIAV